jgi:glycosyltransferase involved in cell wall biosynthesis
VITDRQLYPPRQGTRARIVEVIRSLRSLGFRVVLVGPPPKTWRSRLRTRLLVNHVCFVNAPRFDKGSPLEFDSSPFWPAVDSALQRFKPGIVVAEYIWMTPCLDRVRSGALKVVDTHDVMHVRRHLYATEGTGAWVDCSEAEEAALLRKADVVLAIQRHEKAVFEALVPERRVICVPHAVRVRGRWWRGKPAPNTVMFVGSINQGNLAGIRDFLREGWPLVLEAIPGSELRVYGDIVKQLTVEAAGVTRLGYVRFLGTAYRGSAVVINPVSLGTGLKIKTVEALAYGKALVTTPCGAEGLEEGSAAAFLVAQDMRQLAAEVVQLLQDPVRRRALERNATRWARVAFAPPEVFREFLDFLREREQGSQVIVPDLPERP